MGLDISIQTNNQEVLDADWQHDYYGLHSLSRTFCNFMFRQHNVVNGTPELDQIGQLTGIDIAPLYEMETYPEEQWLDFRLGRADSQEERQKLLQGAEAAKANLVGNLGRVQATIDGLLSKLTDMDDLPELLRMPEPDRLNYAWYFGHFHTDRGDGYLDNTFGQDLRNFKRFLDYAHGLGSTTVFFVYG